VRSSTSAPASSVEVEEYNLFKIRSHSCANFSNLDKKYIQNWADAKRNGLSTFEYNGAKYNSSTGKKIV
jgi:hypothetical protein